MSEKNGVGVDALSAVHEITAKIVASLDLDETLASIAKAMCDLLSADIGAIYLIDEPAGLLRLRGISGERSKNWQGHTMSLDRGMNAMAIRTGQIQRVDKAINHTNGIALLDPLIKALRQQRRLSAIGTLNEALHELPPANRQANHSRQLVFTQPGSIASLLQSASYFRSTPVNGHRQNGPAGLFRANCSHRSGLQSFIQPSQREFLSDRLLYLSVEFH